MATDTNGNGSGNGYTTNKMIWYIMGIFALFLGFSATLVINRMSDLDTGRRENATAIAKIQGEVATVETLSNATRTEQIVRINQLGETNTKIAELGVVIRLLDEKIKNNESKLLEATQRIGKLEVRADTVPRTR